MKMKCIAGALLCACLAGCASGPPKGKYKPIASEAIAGIANGHYVLKTAPTPDFVQMTGGDQATLTVSMLFGAVGGVVGLAAVRANAKARGQALVVENAIPDPTLRLTERIGAILSAKYGSTAGASDYELDIGVDNWAIGKDNVLFFASATLIDARTKRELASGKCRYSNENAPAKPSLDQLLGSKAEGLKREIDKGIDFCADAFDREVFVAGAASAP